MNVSYRTGYQVLVVKSHPRTMFSKNTASKSASTRNIPRENVFQWCCLVTLCSAGQGCQKFLFCDKQNPTSTEMVLKQGEELSCNAAGIAFYRG